MEEIYPVEQLVDLIWQVHTARDQGDPLRPGFRVPQPVRLYKPQDRVNCGHRGDGQQLLLGKSIGPIQENLRKMVIGADMEHPQTPIRNIAGIAVDN